MKLGMYTIRRGYMTTLANPRQHYTATFLATVCKTVCPMLLNRCLSCLYVCLSVTLVAKPLDG